MEGMESMEGSDLVNHPPHYTENPTGVECIQVTEHMDFCLGNAMKYIWRVAFGNKEGNKHVQDLQKAIWYLKRSINTTYNNPDIKSTSGGVLEG